MGMSLANRISYDSMTYLITYMAKVCAITKRGSVIGGRYSNRTRATQFNPCGKIRRYPNLQKKSIFVPELKKSISITVSARGLRTIQKNGAFRTLKKAGLI
jgi:large subunit ribosomal protein L28